jgi:Fe-S-cluster-containing dehydrogenase component
MTDSALLDEYIDLGLYEGQELLVLDLAKCTRCDECVRACADGHGGITRVIRDGPRFDEFLVAISCRSCHDPRCLNGCPVDAIHRQDLGLEVQIDTDRCIGCSVCAKNCPFGSIRMVASDEDGGYLGELPREEYLKLADRYVTTGEMTDSDGRQLGRIKAQVRAANCDLCAVLEDQPEKTASRTPRCVYACPHDAAHRMRGPEVLHQAECRRRDRLEAGTRTPSPIGWLWDLMVG